MNRMTEQEMVKHLREWMTSDEFLRLFELMSEDGATGPLYMAMGREVEKITSSRIS
jgi:hypothetical protein